MLSCLHIENIAVIEQADITFDALFNVMTGETGAGKSIIIDSLGAVLGSRTSRDLVRSGAKKGMVSAVFCDIGKAGERWLGENSFEYEGELIISREIFDDGRSVCRAQGRPVTAAILRELGGFLIDIHGQQDSHALLDDARHLDFLDRWGGVSLDEYSQSYDMWQKTKADIAALAMDEEEKSRKMDTLSYRIAELEEAGLQPGEEEELLQKRKLFKNAGKVVGAVAAAYEALTGGEDSGGAAGLLSAASGELSSAERYSPELGALAQRIQEAYYSIEDCAGELRAMKDGMDFSPEELDRLETRLDIYYRLKQKYKCSSDELPEKLEKWQAELDDIQFSDARLAALSEKENELRERVYAQAAEVSAGRKGCAERFSSRMQEELKGLDMAKVRFDISFKEAQPNIRGTDEVSFLISANVGEPLKSLSKVASGGELARIMLALKNILAESDEIPTLVFDEVDAGVSGRAAQRVAVKLREVSRRKQVLCVTHLPQIAAMADTHFKIEKGVAEGRTLTQIRRLDHQGRAEEIARVISGAEVTASSLASAREMLDQAQSIGSPD